MTHNNQQATTQLTLSARPPFSLPAVVRSHGWIALAPFAYDDATSVLTYVARLTTGRVVTLHIAAAPGGVRVTVPLPPAETTRRELTDMVTWMLGLDQDFSDFYALTRAEPKLAHVKARAQGRLLRSPTLFEDTVKTILTTNTSWSGTIRMVNALVTQFGSPLPGDPDRRAFPTPAQLAASDEATLRSTTRLGYRAPYILALARAVASGDLDLEALKTTDLPTAALRKQLLALQGVGSYAAAHLLMFLGRYDFVPVDSWARTMVAHEWRHGAPVTQADVEAAFERWGAWQGLAYWFWNWSYSPKT